MADLVTLPQTPGSRPARRRTGAGGARRSSAHSLNPRLRRHLSAYGFLIGGVLCFALFSWYPMVREFIMSFQKSQLGVTSWAARSSPAPRTDTPPGNAARPARRRAPARRARPHTSSASITARVARTAAMARGCPPNVEPWSPGPKAAATSARAQQAPTGIPLPSALAMVTTSGWSPWAKKANQWPVRPRPVCTSSSMRRASRSVHRARTAPR